MTNCSCKISCTAVAAFLAVVAGIVTALLTVTGTIVVAPVFYLVAVSIAVVALILLYLGAVFGKLGCSCCRRSAINTILVGVIGALIAGIILIAVGFAATSIIGAILTGFLLAFLTLIFVSTACLIGCVIDCRE